MTDRNVHHKSRPDDLESKAELVAAMATAGRLLAGQTPEQIRADAVKVASKVISEEVADPFVVETLLAIVHRTVERTLLEAGHV